MILKKFYNKVTKTKLKEYFLLRKDIAKINI